MTYAARHRCWQAISLLIEAGADVNIRSVETIKVDTITTSSAKIQTHRGTWGGKTPLFVAASQEGPSVVELLLKHGADVNAIDDAGNNALREAILTGREETVRILLEAGCNSDQRNKEGKTMRELGVGVGYPKINKLLTRNAETPLK